MYYRYLISIFLSLFSNFLWAQTDKLKEVEAMCRYTMQMIEKREYHLNEVRFNSNRFSMHDKGYFQHLVKYYYTQDRKNPEIPSFLLKSVVTRTEKEDKNYYKEWVFDNDNQLVYYAEHWQLLRSLPKDRVRVYFYQGQVLKWIEDEGFEVPQEDQSLEKKKSILTSAEKHLQKFKKQLAEVKMN
jgi:hypothetical protein